MEHQIDKKTQNEMEAGYGEGQITMYMCKSHTETIIVTTLQASNSHTFLTKKDGFGNPDTQSEEPPYVSHEYGRV